MRGSRATARLTSAGLAVVVLVSGAATWISADWVPVPPIHVGSRSALPAHPTATPSPDEPGPVVVAIGDSIMDGHGVTPSRAWPELIGQATNWQLTDLASDGTGFVTLGDDGDTFQTQAVEAVALNPSIVIIAASSNDLGQDPDTVTDATSATFSYLHESLPQARIFALNAFWGADTPPPELGLLDAAVEAAARDTGAHYLDIGQPLAGHPELMQVDAVHPTTKGLLVLAAAIAKAIRSDTARG